VTTRQTEPPSWGYAGAKPPHVDRGYAGAKPPQVDIDRLVQNPGTHIVVCCGSGGVGKTTTAAALALRAAEHGRQVVVLTIDPARRLAQSMGLSHLDNVPRKVDGIDTAAGGRLDAMMLDMKRTFDEVVESHASNGKAAQILANPFYQALSSSFAGTQEYMAMEKLGQLRARGDWDLIVVDTPPSRSALDFLDAPERLGSFLDGRLIRLLMVPARAGGRAYLRFFQAGVSAVTSAFDKILGGELLGNVQTFVSALDTMFGGFRERADQTYALLQRPDTAFVVVATPEPDALREASYFVKRLEADSMPLAGLVLNRIHPDGGVRLGEHQASGGAERLDTVRGHRLTAALLRIYAENRRLAARDNRRASRFVAAHPNVPVARIPVLTIEVNDLDGLRTIGRLLGRPE
jgi:anion-transporting  ArsA/GET3 family ATPase